MPHSFTTGENLSIISTMHIDNDRIDKLLNIGATGSVVPKHARRQNVKNSSNAPSGQGFWFFWVFIAAIPLFIVPLFRLLVGASTLSGALMLAFGNLGMLYIGVTMAITSLSDVVKAGLGDVAHGFVLVSIALLVVGIVAYSLIAIAPEAGGEVADGVKFAVNLTYIGFELVLGLIGYRLIRRR